MEILAQRLRVAMAITAQIERIALGLYFELGRLECFWAMIAYTVWAPSFSARLFGEVGLPHR